MKIIVGFFIFVFSLSVNAAILSIVQRNSLSQAFKHKIETVNVTCEALSNKGFKDFQIKNMYVSYQYGKSRNMGYSLAAIAFKESSAGDPRFMSNPNDPSAGFHGVLLTNVIKKLGLNDNEENRAMVEDMLINSHGASAWFSMEILSWWLNYHKGDWFKAWRSYNGGFYWYPRKNHQEVLKRTWKYAADVQRLIGTIQECNWK